MEPSFQNENQEEEEKRESNVIEWANTDYEPERENKDYNSTKYETFWCCNCDKCIISFAKFWLGCGCTQYGWSILFWYILNLGTDIYNFVTSEESQTLLVLYSFNILFVDIPVLFFTIGDNQYKLIFPFAANTVMAVISMVYAIYVLLSDAVIGTDIFHLGIWILVFDGIMYILTALSLIPMFTYRLRMWEKSHVSYSRLYPHS